MEIKRAIKSQYHAGLAMLRQAIEECPSEVWTAGEHPRTFWRIAYHAIFYTHLYLQTGEDAFRPWEKHRKDVPALWIEDAPPRMEPAYSKAEVLSYLADVDSRVDEWVDAMDLDSPETGFPWYPIPKLDHQLMNIRHLGTHVGQLSELVMGAGGDVDWVAVGKAGSENPEWTPITAPIALGLPPSSTGSTSRRNSQFFE